MSQSFTLESIELLGQPKLQKGKNKRKPIWLGSSGDNLRSTGEYIGHNFLNWKEPRIPSSSPPSIPKINLQFVDDLKICSSCMCTTKSSTFELPQLQVLQKKTWQHGKNKTPWHQNGICWLTPLFDEFFRPQTFYCVMWCYGG